MFSMNVTVAALGKRGNGLHALFPHQEKERTKQLISSLKIKCLGPTQPIERLSGGNQQKTLFARWLDVGASVWLLDEPTRGVDVESKLAIHRLLRELRDKGVALIIVSSEMDELTDLCDRILVMSNKKQVDIFNRGCWSKTLLLEAAFSEYKTKELA
jgi:ribose transport system ATP-binding protein